MNSRSLTKNTLIYLPFKLAEGIAGVITLNRLTALFSTEAYSGFVSVNTAVNLGYLILVAWLSNAAGRYVLELDQAGRRAEHYSSALVSFLAVLVPVWLFCLPAGFFWPNTALRPLFLLAGGMFTAYALFQLASIHLVRLGRVRAFSFVSLLNALLKLVLVIGFFNLKGDASNIVPALLAYISADLFTGLMAVFFLRVPGFFEWTAFSLARCRAYAKYGLPLMGLGLGLGLLNMSDRLLVGSLAGSEAMSVYTANYSVASVVFSMIMAGVMRGVYPPIIAGYSKNGAEGAKPLLNRGVELYVLFALPSAFGLMALGPKISSLMFTRPEYAAGAFVPGIVAFGMFFWGLTEYANKAFELEGNTNRVFVFSLSAAALNILLNLLTLKRFGFYAAAINTMIAFLVYFIRSYTGARKQFVFSLGLKTWCIYIVAALLCGGAALLVSSLIEGGLVSLVAGVLAGMFVYAAVLYFSGRLKAIFSDLFTHS